ncbi:hypothetical protein IMSAG025_00990 [Muribaculaceae bacterium]|nr:hypothetical protein IMSAG025_00990 [Muribaculaceae bacterium]
MWRGSGKILFLPKVIHPSRSDSCICGRRWLLFTMLLMKILLRKGLRHRAVSTAWRCSGYRRRGESFSNIRKSSSSVLTRCLQPKPLFSRRFRRQGDIMTMKRNHLPISIGMQPDRFWNRPTAMRRRFFALTNAISPLPAGRCHILNATV